MTLSYREKLLILMLVVAIVIFGGFKFLVFPSYQNNLNEKNILADLKTKNDQANLNIPAAKNIESAYDNATSKAINAAKPFFPTLDSDELHKWINDIAAKNGLTIQKISISAPAVTTVQNTSVGTAATNYPIKQFADIARGIADVNPSQNKIPAGSKAAQVLESDISLTLTGQYGNAAAFLDAVHNTGRTVTVTQFDIAGAANAVSASITLNCYAAEKLDGSDILTTWLLPPPPGKNMM